MTNDREDSILQINLGLKDWSQGDCVVGESWFVHKFAPQYPLTELSKNLDSNPDNDLVESAVRGLVVVTQTCDIVRSCTDRPFLEVSPLVEIDPDRLIDVKKGKRPQYAYIPGVAALNLVADLDRVMTVEKAMILQWQRVPGCFTDNDKRSVRQALARKRIRVAFPDDFVEFAKKFQQRMSGKHDRNSEEGTALRDLQEIRVRAEPDWDAPEIKLFFWFIRTEDQILVESMNWDKLLKQWLELLPEQDRFSADAAIVSIEDLTAKDYIESDPLDLDHLSTQD